MNPKPEACLGCPAYSLRNGRGYVPGEGPTSASVALVGQGPGQTEAHMGQPFVGYSGQMLDGWLRDADFVRDELWVDNAVRCWLPGNREPRAAELDHCMNAHVKPALRQLTQLKVIVPVGMVSVKAVLGKKVTDSTVGAVIRRELDV